MLLTTLLMVFLLSTQGVYTAIVPSDILLRQTHQSSDEDAQQFLDQVQGEDDQIQTQQEDEESQIAQDTTQVLQGEEQISDDAQIMGYEEQEGDLTQITQGEQQSDDLSQISQSATNPVHIDENAIIPGFQGSQIIRVIQDGELQETQTLQDSHIDMQTYKSQLLQQANEEVQEIIPEHNQISQVTGDNEDETQRHEEIEGDDGESQVVQDASQVHIEDHAEFSAQVHNTTEITAENQISQVTGADEDETQRHEDIEGNDGESQVVQDATQVHVEDHAEFSAQVHNTTEITAENQISQVTGDDEDETQRHEDIEDNDGESQVVQNAGQIHEEDHAAFSVQVEATTEISTANQMSRVTGDDGTQKHEEIEESDDKSQIVQNSVQVHKEDRGEFSTQVQGARGDDEHLIAVGTQKHEESGDDESQVIQIEPSLQVHKPANDENSVETQTLQLATQNNDETNVILEAISQPTMAEVKDTVSEIAQGIHQSDTQDFGVDIVDVHSQVQDNDTQHQSLESQNIVASENEVLKEVQTVYENIPPDDTREETRGRQTEQTHTELHEEDHEVPVRRADDYASALRDLGEAVRSLLPLRELMAVAAECQEGREAAMHNVISAMRGRMVQLEQQVSASREAERECQVEAQAYRALGLESRLAECKARLEERQPPTALVRLEIVSRRHEDADEELKSAPLQQLVTLFEKEGSKLVSLASSLESKMTDIHSISRETLKFVESVQESESEDTVQSEELTRLTTLLNASEATIISLRQQLETTTSKLRDECFNNVTFSENKCTASIVATAKSARAQCDAESARLQGERLGYIVNLHAEHNASLTSAQEACRRELEANELEAKTRCEEAIASKLAAKELECTEECKSHAAEVQEDAAQEQNVTIAAAQANCDDAITAMQERYDAELRLHLNPQIDVRLQQETPPPCVSEPDPAATDSECKGFSEPSATLIEPGIDEVSVRLGNYLYVVSNQKVQNYTDAWNACRERGMWLLAFETLEEQTELVFRVQLLLAGDGEEHSLWTSARRDEHWFRWRCGGWVTPWAPQRIDSDDACLAIAFSRQLGGRIEWRDVSCDEPQQLACEVAVDDML